MIVADMDVSTDTDGLPAQLLLREIEGTSTIDELRMLYRRVQELVSLLLGAGVKIQELISLIAYLNDQVLLRLIGIVRARYDDLDGRFAFVVLGSQGRGEQTLTTDQDSALIHGDGLTAGEIRRLAEFCRDVIYSFVAIGIPRCPGGTMASNEFWCRSSAGWCQEVDNWFSCATLDNIINVAMFSDMRTLYGDPALERDIKRHIAAHLGHNDLFLMKMAANVHYRLVKKKGKWIVYDVVIEGVSLVSNYRSQFNRVVKSDSYAELVRKLETKREELKMP